MWRGYVMVIGYGVMNSTPSHSSILHNNYEQVAPHTFVHLQLKPCTHYPCSRAVKTQVVWTGLHP